MGLLTLLRKLKKVGFGDFDNGHVFICSELARAYSDVLRASACWGRGRDSLDARDCRVLDC